MLTPTQVHQYQQDGFTISPALLTGAEVSSLLAEVDRISDGNTLGTHDRSRLEMEPNQAQNGTLVRRIYEPCTHYKPFRDLSNSAKLLDCVEQLLGANLDFHYSKLNMKPPSIGSVVEWHQDLTYYPLTNDSSVTVLTYLDDASRENGCLLVIPGQHHNPPMNHGMDGFFQGAITEPVDESRAVPLEGQAGSVIFMHCLTPHASTTNTSSRARRTLILGYRAADAVPLYISEDTSKAESYVRHVRGEKPAVARFTFQSFPLPRQKQSTASLYELQELSRKQKSA